MLRERPTPHRRPGSFLVPLLGLALGLSLSLSSACFNAPSDDVLFSCEPDDRDRTGLQARRQPLHEGRGAVDARQHPN